ncbi:hypothetical protein [Fluviicoccus keumensis]|uniref:hypothetical protein n=1 Tax=Fluviicoccus keumensis TaxID=1435465 RepID=UPI00102CAADB|nr:hypothetical protein [Fluviicoccus keumensis]
MHYSAATAPLSLGFLFFTTPHLLVGLFLLHATYTRKCWFKRVRGVSERFGLVIQGFCGLVFFGIVAASNIKGLIDTYRCRNAIYSNETQSLTGPLTITDRFYKPGYGYVVFSVGGRSFRTQIAGGCDCGFITPLGHALRIRDDPNVTVKVFEGKILSLQSNHLP